MANYPSFMTLAESTVELLDDIQLDRATNGAARARVFYTAVKRKFNLKHGGLSATERATLETFYTTNRTTTFSYLCPFDNTTYTVIFSKPPVYTPAAFKTFDVAVELEQV